MHDCRIAKWGFYPLIKSFRSDQKSPILMIRNPWFSSLLNYPAWLIYCFLSIFTALVCGASLKMKVKRELEMPVMFRHNHYHFRRQIENRQKQGPPTTISGTSEATTEKGKSDRYLTASRLPALVGRFQYYFRQLKQTPTVSTTTQSSVDLPTAFRDFCRFRYTQYLPYQPAVQSKVYELCSKYVKAN